MAEIKFYRQFTAPYGVLEWVAPTIRRIVARNPSPFTFHGTGTYVIGRGHVAVIDPGPLLTEHVEALLTALHSETVTHIVVTHTHSDHSPAAAPLKAATGASTFGFGPHAGKHDVGHNGEAADHTFVPDQVLRDGDIIDGSGWQLQVVHTPGHTSNHCAMMRSTGRPTGQRSQNQRLMLARS
jgi:glyoxylase-like metal-dependent hydrolase (beta-lactamase superfamily II)